jgi:hypothetical protein
MSALFYFVALQVAERSPEKESRIGSGHRLRSVPQISKIGIWGESRRVGAIVLKGIHEISFGFELVVE